MRGLLPPLREDLQLKQTEVDHLGRQAWVIHDPARNSFFSLDWLSSELLKRWQLSDAEKVISSTNRETSLDVDTQDLQDFTAFLARNELLQSASAGSTDRLIERSKQSNRGRIANLFKHYLYLRIPLLNPEPLLEALYAWVAPLRSCWFTWITGFVLFVGLFQLSRRWDLFVHSFTQIFNLQSLLQAGLVVVLVKILHEFGHAFAAYSRGCRVPRMGVVFLVLFPVAYTNVTDSWKLKPQDRMAVGLAGMRVELMIAAWATLIWGLLPPGGFRDGLFLILTVTWIGTLLINASPFMRFDGYFVLMDHWRLPNLHQRAGGLGRWWLRKIIFGTTDATPEYLGRAQSRVLIFAYLTWIYRLFVFLGIAWLVYEVVPQPFGLLLAAIELLWFILLPVAKELGHWPKLMFQSLLRPQLWFSGLLLLLAALTLFYPWRDAVTVQAVLMPERELVIESQVSARLVNSSRIEGPVKQGDVLATFENSDLEYQLARLAIRQQRLEWMLSQKGFMDDLLASELQVRAQLTELYQEKRALNQRAESLILRAPAEGYFVPVEEALMPGSWVSLGTALGTLYSDEHTVVGYLTATQRFWVDFGGAPVWQSDLLGEEVALGPIRVAAQATEFVEVPLLLKAAGGEIAARQTTEGWVPDEAVYKFSADLLQAERLGYAHTSGEIALSARPHSHWMLLATGIEQQFRQDFGSVPGL